MIILDKEILFAKLREDVKIPTKREEDGAFDIYANFSEDYMVIEPHTTKLIPTGLASAFSSDYVAILKERGSTGTKGIGQRCGVIDSGFRGEWFVPLTNHNNIPLVIAKNQWVEKKSDKNDIRLRWLLDELLTTTNHQPNEEDLYIIYPYNKAICQCIMVEVPKLKIEEVTIDEIMSIESERGTGALGSSGK